MTVRAFILDRYEKKKWYNPNNRKPDIAQNQQNQKNQQNQQNQHNQPSTRTKPAVTGFNTSLFDDACNDSGQAQNNISSPVPAGFDPFADTPAVTPFNANQTQQQLQPQSTQKPTSADPFALFEQNSGAQEAEEKPQFKWPDADKKEDPKKEADFSDDFFNSF